MEYAWASDYIYFSCGFADSVHDFPHGNSGMFHPLVHQIPVEPGFFLGSVDFCWDLGQKKLDLIV
jgi:hypothetical protein